MWQQVRVRGLPRQAPTAAEASTKAFWHGALAAQSVQSLLIFAHVCDDAPVKEWRRQGATLHPEVRNCAGLQSELAPEVAPAAFVDLPMALP